MKSPTTSQLAAVDTKYGDELVMKLGIGFTLYFKRPFLDVRHGVHQFWLIYRDFIGDNFTWARLGGGNRSRKVNSAVYKTMDTWFSGTASYGPICWMSIHDGPFDCMGNFGLELVGEGPVEFETDERSGFVHVVFPISTISNIGEEGFIELACKMAASVDYHAGVAGYCFQRSPYTYMSLLPRLRALSRRFVGVEITAAHRLAYLAERGVPTVNWLTFVGKEHLDRLGGLKFLSGSLHKQLSIKTVGSGVVIICGGGASAWGCKRPRGRSIQPKASLFYYFESTVCESNIRLRRISLPWRRDCRVVNEIEVNTWQKQIKSF